MALFYDMKYNKNRPHGLHTGGQYDLERVTRVIDNVDAFTGHAGDVAIVAVGDHKGVLGLYVLTGKTPEEVCEDEVIQAYFAEWLSEAEYEACIFYIGYRAKDVNVTLKSGPVEWEI